MAVSPQPAVGLPPISRSPAAELSPRLIVWLLLPAAALLGALTAFDIAIGLAALAALCFAPLALLNLPLALALWLPTVFLKSLPGFDLAAYGGGLVIAVAWLGTLRRRTEPQEPALRFQRVLLAAFLTWLTVSIAWAERPGQALTSLLPWIAAAVVFVILSSTELSGKQLRALALGYVGGVALSVIVGLIGGLEAATSLSAITEQEGRLQGGAGDPNYLAAAVVPALVLCVGMMPSVRKPERVGLAAIGVLLVVGLVATESRGGILAAIVGLVAATIVARRERTYVIVLIAAVLGVGALWFASSPEAGHRVTSTADDGNGRGSLWTVAWRISEDHPVVGVGLDNFRVHAPRYTRQSGELTFVKFIVETPHVVHNVYLELLVEAGAIGLAMFVLLIGASLRAARRAARGFDSIGANELASLSRAIFVALLAGLTASFFLSNGTDYQLWALLALGPAAAALAHRYAGSADHV